jgi:hypothetical protein
VARRALSEGGSGGVVSPSGIAPPRFASRTDPPRNRGGISKQPAFALASARQADVIHRPYSLRPRASRRLIVPSNFALVKRGRAERRGHNNPAASCDCELDFTRASHHAVAGSPGAPRAVFIGLLRSAPGGLPVSGNRASLPIGGPPIHRCGPKWCPAHLTVPAAIASGAQRRTEWCAGTERLGPLTGLLRRISDTPASHRSPPQHLTTLIKRPS